MIHPLLSDVDQDVLNPKSKQTFFGWAGEIGSSAAAALGGANFSSL